ncbi:hypothetical protein Y032_0106g3752 [Ancylostoma ceylanicum]|uniref:Uncharacterized protein n=1 Tax=Ancylostoma ceylanicum TaxID=53326 RepID=A0A016TFY9_9BILA|nr:hypothetical protein Y032_0106g3752 [Ancylostoma ceylanicum]
MGWFYESYNGNLVEVRLLSPVASLRERVWVVSRGHVHRQFRDSLPAVCFYCISGMSPRILPNQRLDNRRRNEGM